MTREGCRLLSAAIGCYRLLSAAIGCYRLPRRRGSGRTIVDLFAASSEIARRDAHRPLTDQRMAQPVQRIGVGNGRSRPLLCDKSSGAWLLGLTCFGLLCTVRVFSPVCVLRATYGWTTCYSWSEPWLRRQLRNSLSIHQAPCLTLSHVMPPKGLSGEGTRSRQIIGSCSVVETGDFSIE